MIFEKLKLQLFAAEDEEIDNPVDGEQDDEIVDVDDDAENDENDEFDEFDEFDDDESEEDTEGGEEESEEEEEDDKPFMVFKTKDEHQAYMDNIIGKRLGEQRKKNEEYDNLLHTFEQYFEVEGIEGLKKKAEELLEDIAYQRGTTKEKLLQQQREQQELRNFRAMQEQQRQQTFLNAFTADCEKLSKSNPELYGDIKPDELIQNKRFLQMLGYGIPFKQAYDALHVDELVKKQTAKAKKSTLDNVKAKGTRISENATKRTKAASIKIDPSKMTDEQIAELEERAARGERITF
ncbi:MAG: hypothetical protein WAP07_03165 [Acutalibacteraceae bacterium]